VVRKYLALAGFLLRADLGQSIAIILVAVAFMWGAPGGVFVALDTVADSLPWSKLFANAHVHNPLLSDTVAQYYPWRHFFDETLGSGTWPLWNPYILAGHPTFASINEQVFYPLNILFAVLPAPISFGWLALVHLAIAGIGVRAFAKLTLRDDPSAFLAGVAFMLSGPVVVWLEYPAFLSTWAWTGWIFFFLERLLRQRQPRDAALLGLAIGVELLGGQAQYSLYLALMVTAYAAARLSARALGHEPSVRSAFCLSLLASAIGGGIGAIAYVPALELTGQVNRAPSDLPTLLGSALPLTSAVTFVLPNALGSPTRGDFVGFGNYNESIVYLGLLPVVLVGLLPLVALARRTAPSKLTWNPASWGGSDDRLVLAIFGTTALVVVLLLFGWRPAVTLFWEIPPVRYFGLNRLSIVLTFVVGWLAALSYARLAVNGRLRWVLTFVVLGAGGVLLGALALGALAQRNRPGPEAFAWHDLKVALVLAALGTAALIGRIWSNRTGRAGTMLRWLGPVALAADLFWFGHDYNTVLSRDLLSTGPLAPLGSLPTGPFAARSAGLSPERLVFPPNLGMVWNIPTPDGYVSEAVDRYAAFAEHANVVTKSFGGTRFQAAQPSFNFLKFSQIRAPYIDLLGVRYIVAQPELELPDIFRRAQGAESPPIAGATTVGATFYARQNGLNRIDVYPVATSHTSNGWIALHLVSDPGSTEHIAYVRVANREAAAGHPLSFWFKPIANSAGRSFYFYLDAPDASPNDAVTLAEGNDTGQDTVGTLLHDGRPRPGVLSFDAYATPLANWPKVTESNDLAVYQNPEALPRGFLVERIRVATDDQFYESLDRGTIDPHRVAVVSGTPPPDLGPALLDGPNAPALPAELLSAGTQEVVLRTSASHPALLVVSNVWYPGWQATVDGIGRPVERVDATFQGVYLTAGEHTVRLVFAPTSLKIGLLLGLAGATAAVLAFTWRPRCRSRD
jgi:hypothetical protein